MVRHDVGRRLRNFIKLEKVARIRLIFANYRLSQPER